MNRINVFKHSTFLVRFYIIFGLPFSILGILLLRNAFAKGFNTNFPDGDWNSVIYICQGLLFTILGIANLYVKKYYIEWDDSELRLFLPDTKNLEIIKISDIKSVNIKLFEIELGLLDKSRTLDLSNLRFGDLRKIKEKFEEIKVKKNN